jgi:hypothetical protein
MRPIGCPETSVRNYHSTLCKILKDRVSHLQDRRSRRKPEITQTCIACRTLGWPRDRCSASRRTETFFSSSRWPDGICNRPASTQWVAGATLCPSRYHCHAIHVYDDTNNAVLHCLHHCHPGHFLVTGLHCYNVSGVVLQTQSKTCRTKCRR